MGAGKTTVLAEATDLLASARIAHAAIDLDFITIAYTPQELPEDLKLRNLAALWKNYSEMGITNLLLSEPIVSLEAREQLRRTIPCRELVVCRLRARLSTMQRRVGQRELGIFREKYIARVAELEHELADARLDDFSVENDGRDVTDVAREVLMIAGWL